MTPNHKIIFVAFMNTTQVGALVGGLECGVYCDKGNGGGTRERERDRKIQRERGRERRQRGTEHCLLKEMAERKRAGVGGTCLWKGPFVPVYRLGPWVLPECILPDDRPGQHSAWILTVAIPYLYFCYCYESYCKYLIGRISNMWPHKKVV